MNECPKCGQPLGSNKDCEECLKYLIQRGADTLDEKSAQQVEQKAREWLEEHRKSVPSKLVNLVRLFSNMIGDYFKGNYKQVPWRTIATAAFAVLYAINIFDLVPDIIPVLGWLDDIAVAGLVLSGVKKDLRQYCEFRGLNPSEFGL